MGEGLPEEDVPVILFGPRWGRGIGYLTDGIWASMSGIEVDLVTHWRELPEPPQEGGSNG